MTLRTSLTHAMMILGFLSLTGCGLLPGMAIDNSVVYSQKTPVPNPVTPTIVSITPDIMKQVSQDLMPYHYYIGPGDKVVIAVWNHPEFSSPEGEALSNPIGIGSGSSSALTTIVGSGVLGGGSSSSNGIGDYLVDYNGNVSFPLLGPVHIGGLTETQAAALMAQKLSLYIKNPQVTVRVDAFSSQQVYLMGELGGTGNTSAVNSVPITDTPMTLAFALAQAGGINVTTADTNEVYVIRGNSSMTHPVVYWFDAESPAAMIYAENFPLMNNDVIFVSPAGITRANRVINQILPAIETIWYTKSVVNSN